MTQDQNLIACTYVYWCAHQSYTTLDWIQLDSNKTQIFQKNKRVIILDEFVDSSYRLSYRQSLIKWPTLFLTQRKISSSVRRGKSPLLRL